MVQQQGYVPGPVPQRRQNNGYDVNAVVEGFTETAGSYQFLQVFVGCRDEAEVDLFGALSPDPGHDPVFQHAQELGLQRQT